MGRIGTVAVARRRARAGRVVAVTARGRGVVTVAVERSGVADPAVAVWSTVSDVVGVVSTTPVRTVIALSVGCSKVTSTVGPLSGVGTATGGFGTATGNEAGVGLSTTL